MAFIYEEDAWVRVRECFRNFFIVVSGSTVSGRDVVPAILKFGLACIHVHLYLS
jgi:hypothetical protein